MKTNGRVAEKLAVFVAVAGESLHPLMHDGPAAFANLVHGVQIDPTEPIGILGGRIEVLFHEVDSRPGRNSTGIIERLPGVGTPVHQVGQQQTRDGAVGQAMSINSRLCPILAKWINSPDLPPPDESTRVTAYFGPSARALTIQLEFVRVRLLLIFGWVSGHFYTGYDNEECTDIAPLATLFFCFLASAFCWGEPPRDETNIGQTPS